MDGNPISGLYPQPAQQQPGLFNQNPLALIPAIQQLQALGARNAIGQAVQGAIGPNGAYDPAAALSEVGRTPAAAYGALEAVGTLQQQRQQQIQNQTSQFGLAAGQSGLLQNFVAGLASNPSATPDQVRSMATALAARTGIDPSVVNSVLAGMPNKGGKAMQQYWANISNATQGAGATAGQVSAGVGPQGEQYTAPAGAVTSQGGTQQSLPAGQAPLIAASREELGKDQSSSAALLQGTRPLLKALPLVEQLSNRSFGPQSAGWAKLKASLQEAGVIQPNTTDTEVYQEANKYLKQVALSAPGATRSNEGLETAIKARPDLDLTQGANLSLLKNQIGFDRMDAALPIAFKGQNPGSAADANYKTYKTNYYQANDPRAFQFDIMTPAEQAKTVKDLGPKGSPAYTKFMNSLRNAHMSGVLSPPGGAGAGQ
jgi:hypothetical protein